METIRFSQAQGRFFKDLHREVNAYLRTRKYGAYAPAGYWVKAITLLLAIAFFYTCALLTYHALTLFAAFIVMGFGMLLLALNVAHDAAHHSISRHQRLNQWLYLLSFGLQGANGLFWQKRHLHEHHPFPNVPDRDPDLLNVKWLRYTSVQPFKKYHAFQCWYAPLLYAVYTLYWIFVKDFSLSGTPVSKKTFARMLMVNVLHKTAYLFVFLFLPMMTNDHGLLNVYAFLLMHVFISFFLVFTFAMSHYISGQPETVVENGVVANSWEMHQVSSSVDFHVNSPVALFVFGGFNCHVAHHLFPSVSHVHYPAITRMIYRHLKKTHLQPRQVTFWQGIKLHFKLLKEMSRK